MFVCHACSDSTASCTTTANSSLACCNPTLATESVAIAYSTNGGMFYSLVSPTLGLVSAFAYTQAPTILTIPLPLGAKSANTKFLFYQPLSSGQNLDEWVIVPPCMCVGGCRPVYFSRSVSSFIYFYFLPIIQCACAHRVRSFFAFSLDPR